MSADFETDVFVSGGGPAGLAVAIAARRMGFRATVADSLLPPVDKACGEGLLPDALLALRKLGIELDPAEGFPFRGIRFLDGALRVDASFPNGQGIGLRRTILHSKMAQHAANLGVDLLWGRRVSGIDGDRVRVGNATIRSRWIVGADGNGSLIRRWSELDNCLGRDLRFGFRLHYHVAPWTDCMEIYWGSDCQIYVTPVGVHEVCVTLISRNKRLRIERVLGQFPDVLARLNGAPALTMARGAISATQRFKAIYRGRVALAGDASGSVDAITGRESSMALQQALALAEALDKGDLALYQAAHERILRRPALMARAVLLIDSRARLRKRVMRAFSSSPPIFARMLATHVGAASPFRSATNGFHLGWRVLAG